MVIDGLYQHQKEKKSATKGATTSFEPQQLQLACSVMMGCTRRQQNIYIYIKASGNHLETVRTCPSQFCEYTFAIGPRVCMNYQDTAQRYVNSA